MRKISPRLIYFFGALGGLLFGYDTGVISGAILYVKRTLDLTALEEGMVVSSVLTWRHDWGHVNRSSV